MLRKKGGERETEKIIVKRRKGGQRKQGEKNKFLSCFGHCYFIVTPNPN